MYSVFFKGVESRDFRLPGFSIFLFADLRMAEKKLLRASVIVVSENVLQPFCKRQKRFTLPQHCPGQR